MTADLLSTIQPEPKRDHFGRYLLPDPDNADGKALPWTRATTLAKTIADTYGLGLWQQRMVAKGIATRRDLYALASATDVSDKKAFDRLCKDAREAASASQGSNLGTALHSFTERVDRGELVDVPEPWNADVAAYVAALKDANITMDPALIERIVVNQEMRVAGTFDRIAHAPEMGHVIGDLKTGKDLTYGWGDIAIQLAIYARAPVMWNAITDAYEPLPAVNQDVALVIHLPVGQAKCDLYWVDIAAGWEAVTLCMDVRKWRGRRDLAVKFAGSRDWLTGIAAAGSMETLTTIYQDAMTAGAWNQSLLSATKSRKLQLDTKESK